MLLGKRLASGLRLVDIPGLGHGASCFPAVCFPADWPAGCFPEGWPAGCFSPALATATDLAIAVRSVRTGQAAFAWHRRFYQVMIGQVALLKKIWRPGRGPKHMARGSNARGSN